MIASISPEPRQEPPRFEIVARDGKPVDEPTQKGRTLTGESPLLVLPGLACEVGLPESVFLNQLHYLATHGFGEDRDGHRWVFNTYDEWRQTFPFWSADAIGRMVRKLTEKGLIEVTAKYNTSSLDQRRWYRLRYEHPCIAKFQEGRTDHSAEAHNADAESQIAPAESHNADANSQNVNRNRDFRQRLQTENGNTTPVVPEATDPPPKRPRSEKQQKSDELFERRNALYGAYCRALGIDPDGFDGQRRRNRAFGDLKPIDDAAEFDADVMERLTRYTMACMGWRKGNQIPSVTEVLNAFAEWKRDGEPAAPGVKTANGPHRSTNGRQTDDEREAVKQEALRRLGVRPAAQPEPANVFETRGTVR